MPRLVVDGVSFQGGDPLAGAFWEDILAGLAREFDIVLLDRGNAPGLAGAQRWPFPNWSGRETAADSALLEEVCQALGAAFFLSTAWTTPLETPAVAVVPNLLPAIADTDAPPASQDRRRLEEEAAIFYARRRICVTAEAAAELARTFPELDARRTSTVELGVDPAYFGPEKIDPSGALPRRLGLSRNFVVLVEDPFSPPAHRLDPVPAPKRKALDWVVVDERRVRSAHIDVPVPPLHELGCLLSAAAAIAIAPTLRTLPLWVDAAQKCGRPALLHTTAAQPERLRDTVTVVDEDWSIDAIMRAVDVAKALPGYGRASGGLPYAPDRLARHIAAMLRKVREEVDRGMHSEFFRTWAKLRQLQARVDY